MGPTPSEQLCLDTKCEVCLQTMDGWDSTEIRIYKLIQRPA